MFKNVFWAYTNTLVQLLTGLWLTPRILNMLGDTQYGLLSTATHMAAYASFLEWGLPQTVARLIGYYNGKKNTEKSSHIFACAISIAACITLVCALFFICYFLYGNQNNTKLCLFLLLASQISYTLSISGMFLGATQNLHIYYIGTVFLTLLKTCLTYVLLLKYKHIYAIPISSIFSQSLGFVFFSYWIHKNTFFKFTSLLNWNKEIFLSVFSLGFQTVLSATPSNILPRIAPLSIYFFTTATQVTSYSIAYTFISYIITTSSAGIGFLFHSFAFLDGSGSHEKSKILFLKSTSALACLTSATVGCSLLIYPSFVFLWLKKPYTESFIPFVFLAISHIFALIQMSSLVFFNGKGLHLFYGKWLFIEIVFQLLLTALFHQHFSIAYAALAFALPCLLVRGCILPYHATSLLCLSMRHYVSEILPGLLAAGLSFLCIRTTLPTHGLMNISQCITTVVLYGLSYLVFLTLLLITQKKLPLFYATGLHSILSQIYRTLKPRTP
jgi:O-antigen/teichoic acid export membrane protein